MERSNPKHPMVMKMIFLLLLLIKVSCFAQNTLPIYTHEYLIAKDLNCCKGAENQLECIDSLIAVNLKAPNYTGKIDRHKAYLDRFRKLGIYNFYAGVLSGMRGELEQSFVYFDKMDRYFDTLSLNGKGDEFETLKSIALYQKTEFCVKAYAADTAAFNRCNCMQFFAGIKDEPMTSATGSLPKEDQKPVVRYPYWGEFYINDTLRINKRFVSDSVSVVYFRQILQPLIQAKLLQNPSYFEVLGDPSLNLKSDTVIYKLSARYEKGKYERNCEVVFASSQRPEIFDHVLLLMATMEFPGFIRDLEIYIPIVFTTENAINSKASVYDDHFRIEIAKIKQIRLD